MRQKRFTEAIPLWRDILDLNPGRLNAIFQLARAYHRSAELEEAIDLYLRVATLNPSHDKALSALAELGQAMLRPPFSQTAQRDRAADLARRLIMIPGRGARSASALLAQGFVKRGEVLLERSPHDALADFQQALDLAPSLAPALRGTAACRERLQQHDDALVFLDRLTEPQPETTEPGLRRDQILVPTERPSRSAQAPLAGGELAPEKATVEAARIGGLLQAARAALKADKVKEAEARYRDVLELEGNHVQALASLSRLYRRERRFGEAVELLTHLQRVQPSSVETKEMLAWASWKNGQLGAALRIYTELIESDPDNPQLLLNLGRIRAQLGEWDVAAASLSRLSELQPDRLDVRVELAIAFNRGGRAKDALVELEHVLRVDPNNFGALRQFARILQKDEPEKALALWARVAEFEPAQPEPFLQTARLLVHLGRKVEAEEAFRKVLDRRSDNREALVALARIVAERDPVEGLLLLSEWRRQNPNDAAPLLAIARLNLAMRDVEQAEAAFLDAKKFAHDNAEVLIGLGRLYSSTRRIDDAIAIWSEVLEAAPETMEPKLQLARLLHSKRDPRVEVLLQSVLELEPEHREALRLLAQFYTRSASTRERALEVWQRLAQLDPTAALPLVYRARLLQGAGRIVEAEAEFRRALERDATHPMALGDLARFFRLHRRYEEAIEIYQVHLRLEPSRMEAILGLGQCLDRLHRLHEALDCYQRALAQEPYNVTALGYRARLLRTQGQVDAAIGDFREICRIDPGNADAWHELIFQLAGAEREQEALAMVEEAEAALGPSPRTWGVLGRACAAALFDKRAVEFFDRAIAAEPDNAANRSQLGLYYLNQGVFDAALHNLLDSREIDPRNVPVARALFDVTRGLHELGFDHVALRRAPRTIGEILLPERLFVRVRELANQVKPYEPVPRRIVAISATLAPGGAERQLVTMLAGLSQPRFDLDLTLFCISLTPRFRRDFFLPILHGTGIDVVLPDLGLGEEHMAAPEVAPYAQLLRHFPKDMVTPIAFWLREFRSRRPQVVHAWQDLTCVTAVVAALLAGVPRIVLCCRSVRPDNPRRRLRRFMREAYRAVLTHPSVILSNNSRAGANDYAAWLEVAPSRIEVVHNGIDFERLAHSANPNETRQARARLGIPSNAPILGGVFRMSEEKRPLLWLDVAAAVVAAQPDVHFVVCGDGPMRDEIHSRAVSLGIADKLHLPGAQSNIGSWFKLMDVVMLTSRHEGLPNVLLEAQALGVPVVAPDVGGAAEVIEQGRTGWTVKNADATLLAERVLHCLTDGEWRRTAAERAPQFVRERFGIETMLRRNLDVYGIS